MLTGPILLDEVLSSSPPLPSERARTLCSRCGARRVCRRRRGAEFHWSRVAEGGAASAVAAAGFSRVSRMDGRVRWGKRGPGRGGDERGRAKGRAAAAAILSCLARSNTHSTRAARSHTHMWMEEDGNCCIQRERREQSGSLRSSVAGEQSMVARVLVCIRKARCQRAVTHTIHKAKNRA